MPPVPLHRAGLQQVQGSASQRAPHQHEALQLRDVGPSLIPLPWHGEHPGTVFMAGLTSLLTPKEDAVSPKNCSQPMPAPAAAQPVGLSPGDTVSCPRQCPPGQAAWIHSGGCAPRCSQVSGGLLLCPLMLCSVF